MHVHIYMACLAQNWTCMCKCHHAKTICEGHKLRGNTGTRMRIRIACDMLVLSFYKKNEQESIYALWHDNVQLVQNSLNEATYTLIWHAIVICSGKSTLYCDIKMDARLQIPSGYACAWKYGHEKPRAHRVRYCSLP